jgi:hypothetical protein
MDAQTAAAPSPSLERAQPQGALSWRQELLIWGPFVAMATALVWLCLR